MNIKLKMNNIHEKRQDTAVNAVNEYRQEQ